MNKTPLLLLLTILLYSSLDAQEHYVSDNLYTYLHSGPGTQYKIIGSVNAGDKIEVLQKDDGGDFTQIKDPKGRIAWIRSKFVSNQSGFQERYYSLQKDFQELHTQQENSQDDFKQHIANLETELQIKRNKVIELQSINESLNKKLLNIETLNKKLNEKLDNGKNELLMRYFTYGGMVGGVGLLFGLILPSIMPNSRKRNRW